VSALSLDSGFRRNDGNNGRFPGDRFRTPRRGAEGHSVDLQRAQKVHVLNLVNCSVAILMVLPLRIRKP
jgi:hypothetical protein